MLVKPLILSYHAVSSSWPTELAIAPHVLREQLALLHRRGFIGLTASEAERRRQSGALPERSVVVTFDDGYASILNAKPILDEFGFPGTVFVVTNFVDSGAPLLWPGLERWSRSEHCHELRPLTWSSLEELVASGWEVGSHTVTHRLVTSIPATALESELTVSRLTIATRLGSCTALAYPYGVSDGRVEAAASRAGYEVAYSLTFSHQRDEPYRRARLELTSRDSGLRLALQLTVVRRLRRTKGAKLVRKLRLGPHWLPANAGEEIAARDNLPEFTSSSTDASLRRRPLNPAPIATILMAVRNGEHCVTRAINSLLTQTRGDFELIVIDDASTDGTSHLLERIGDPRIIVTQRAEPGGAGTARNIGLACARGKYIAILDADDAALPWRLERQVRFLERRPDIAMVGSALVIIDEEGVPRGFRAMPSGTLAVRWTALLKSPFAHSSVMFRADVLRRSALKYDQAFAPSEDYDLCARVLEIGYGENIRDPLVFYRVHPQQLTNVQRERQLRLHDAIVRRTIEVELPDFRIDGEELTTLWQLFAGARVIPEGQIALGHRYLDLFTAFRARHADDLGIEALTRTVVRTVMFRCLGSSLGNGRRDLAARLLELDPTAFGLFPLDVAALALRRTRWCWNPRIRREASLAAFSAQLDLGVVPRHVVDGLR